MNYDEFCIEFKKYASLMNIVIEDEKIEKFYKTRNKLSDL